MGLLVKELGGCLPSSLSIPSQICLLAARRSLRNLERPAIFFIVGFAQTSLCNFLPLLHLYSFIFSSSPLSILTLQSSPPQYIGQPPDKKV